MKKMRKFLTILLCICLLCLPFSAVMVNASNELTIKTADEFLEFAENCRLDSYSQNLTVVLAADIDLSGIDLEPIPTFSGVFDGGGYTLSGVSIKGAGSVQGLFRYVTASAVIKDLNVSGEIAPTGSKSNVGGIAGSNAGKIDNCTFSGSVSGADNVGGIAGLNEGVINNCKTSGMVCGNHFVGGIAGENQGQISRSKNSAEVNTTVQQNSVEISDITIDSLTNTEYAATVTDIGGIAGGNTGKILNCENRADVGYKHIGYNIGGIAGSQSGYIYNCMNTGNISGRKEVGGIAGQIEPATLVEYSVDTLQILEGQLDTMQYLTNNASQNAQDTAGVISGQLDVLQGHSQSAQNALGILLQNMQKPENMNFDAMQAAYNSLNSSLAAMGDTVQDIGETTEAGVNELSGNLQSISSQMNSIGATIDNASQTTGAAINDVSDEDTSNDISAKIEKCSNLGDVLADLNAGGIAGTIGIENDLDHEEDIEFSGEMTTNMETKLRAVILSCKNSGSVTVKRQNAGGIVGRMTLGLAKKCVNTGSVEAESADYVGGVAGQSGGYIRYCSAKCQISGSSYVGGITGKADIVSDCRASVRLTVSGEKAGAVIGYSEERSDINGNYYMAVGSDMGAIDGISYSGAAQLLSADEFLALDELDSAFKTVTVDFVFEDGTVESISVPFGEGIAAEDIPKIPEKSGYTAQWEGLDGDALEAVEFDTVYRAVYLLRSTTVQCEETRSDGLPILLVEGTFEGGADIALSEITEEVSVSDKQETIEAWQYELCQGSSAQTLRFLPEEKCEAEDIAVFVRNSDGEWRAADFSITGSYVVFDVAETDNAFCIAEALPDYTNIIRIAVSALCVLLIVIILVIRKLIKKKKK